jgi:DNA replication protein DnaC
MKDPLQSMEKELILSSVNGSSKPPKESNLFYIRKANDWLEEARLLPEPKYLYDNLWVEGETAFLFGGTGTGKSLLAVQIGKHISESQPVLYFDFELSNLQFANRYFAEDKKYAKFPDGFFRIEIKRDVAYNTNQLVKKIHETAQESKAKIIIIDNLTWISTGTEKAYEAANIMKELSALRRNYNYSFLILSHTPKRDETRPVNINDMAGSMVLTNFTDTSFCIAKSFKGENIRYIKQLKVRSSEIFYCTESVWVIRISKSEDGFLGFEDKGISSEREHLKEPNSIERSEKKKECYELLDQGISYQEISKRLELAKGTISKYSKQRKLKTKNNDSAPF